MSGILRRIPRSNAKFGLNPFIFRGVMVLAVFSLAVAKGGAGEKGEDRFGHHAYAEASQKELTRIGSYRGTRPVLMRTAAAQAFRDMVSAAQNDGVSLIPISGFRSIATQKILFARSVRRRGSELAAAQWVAPPGHSEHATGWVLDLGDKNRPDTDVEQSFEDTPAFRWLFKNAGRFHFEMSFPKGNQQGVSYEPWHWRFVGFSEASSVFYLSPNRKIQ